MVTLIFLCTRRAGISHARYADLLLTRHVPLALRHHPTLRRYTVNIVERAPDGEAALDSVGTLAFETLADFHERLYDSPHGEQVIARDVADFLGGAHAYATTAVVHRAGAAPPLGARAPGLTLFCPVRRRPDLSHADFVRHWQTVHVPLALAHHPHMTRYVTYLIDASLSPDAPPWDGFAEITLATPTSPMFGDAAGEAAIRADIARFIGHTFAYVVAAYEQKPLRPLTP